jgi:hypothetical protein
MACARCTPRRALAGHVREQRQLELHGQEPEPRLWPASGEYFVKTRGPGNLDQERMRSRELGYNGYFSDIDLSMDVKLFYDEITGMISEP